MGLIKESTSSKSSSITITEKSEIVNIEITQDNWQDYFTIEEMLVTSKNDFGDYGRIEDFSVDFYLNLKNEYVEFVLTVYDFAYNSQVCR